MADIPEKSKPLDLFDKKYEVMSDDISMKDVTDSDSKVSSPEKIEIEEKDNKYKTCQNCTLQIESSLKICSSCSSYQTSPGELVDLSQTYMRLPSFNPGLTTYPTIIAENKWFLPPPITSQETIGTDSEMQDWVLNHIPSEEAKLAIIRAGEVGFEKVLAELKKKNSVDRRAEERKEEIEKKRKEILTRKKREKIIYPKSRQRVKEKIHFPKNATGSSSKS